MLAKWIHAALFGASKGIECKMKKIAKTVGALTLIGLLAACNVDSAGHYTSTAAKPENTVETASAPAAAVNPAEVQLFSGAPGRTYTEVKKLKIDVNKLTAFHANPTEEDARNRLKQEAAKLGADAVINVEISDVKVTALSWGARTVSGTAIKY